jgi:glycosidase
MQIKPVLRWLGLGLLLAALLPVAHLSVQARGGDNGGSGGGGGEFLHNDHYSLYRTPLGAVPVNSTVMLRLRTGANQADAVTLRVWDDVAQQQNLLPMQVVTTTTDGNDLWEVPVEVGKNPTILWYRFIVQKKDGSVVFYEDDFRPSKLNGAYDPGLEGGVGAVYDTSPDLSWQITVYDPDFYTPEWMRNAVIYQIFPDRFRDGDLSNDPTDGSLVFYDGLRSIFHETWNEPPVDPRQPGEYQNRWNVDFFGGDLAGITEKLDYLQALGVTAIYLNPIFEARSNHRYDTADFKQIDPMLGTLEDFQTLVAEADKRGIVLILDGVFNHMSSDSPAFDRYGRYDEVGACESLDSPYRLWFFFVPPKGQQPSPCVENPQGATYYVSWAGYDTIPKLNSDNNGVRLYVFLGRNSVVNTWGREGIGGWRLDVAGDIDAGGPASDYWEGFRVAVRNANPEGVIIGEEWGNASRWLLGSEWDSAMNYRLRRGILGFVRNADYTDNDANGDNVIYAMTPTELDSLIHDLQSDYPPMAFDAMMNILDSHDTSRLLFVAGDKDRQRLAALIQFALPGAPTIYYGDEIGINAPSVDDNGTLQDDPYNRAPYPWPDTSGDAYGPPDDDMLSFYQMLAALRHANPALREGELITLLTDDTKGVYAFLRVDRAAGNVALVVVNKSDVTQSIVPQFGGNVPVGMVLQPAFGGHAITVGMDSGPITVGALSGNIWTATADAPFGTPQPPANLAAEGHSGGVILTWDAAPDTSAYVIYRSPVAVGGFVPLDVTSSVGYVDVSTVNGYRYYYAVASVSADGLIGDMGASLPAIPSARISSTAYLMDDTPQNVTLAYGLTTTIRASVQIKGATEPDGQAVGVRAEAALVPAGADLDAITNWKPMSFTGEDNGADVYEATIPVTAVGDFVQIARFTSTAGETWTIVTLPDGTWPPLAVAVPEDATAPDPPASVSILEVSLDGVIVTWEASPSADVAAYRVYRTFEGQTQVIAEVPAGQDLRYQDKAVAPGLRYSYAISAVDTSLNESEAIPTEEVTVERRAIPVTFTVTVPDYTINGEGDVYIAGDFGTASLPFWDPAGIVMTQLDDQHWTVTLNIPEGAKLQYKYVRGTWDAVEKGPECEEIANRTLTVEVPEGQTELLVDGDVVAKWRDLDKCG